MVTSGVLLLPSLSSSSHCQKQVIAIKTQLLQPSDPIYSLINSLNHGHEFIDQTVPNKTQSETSRVVSSHSPTPSQSFLRVERAPRTPSRSTRSSYAPTHSRSTCPRRSTSQSQFTCCHISPKVTSSCHINVQRQLIMSANVILLTFRRWLLNAALTFLPK